MNKSTLLKLGLLTILCLFTFDIIKAQADIVPESIAALDVNINTKESSYLGSGILNADKTHPEPGSVRGKAGEGRLEAQGISTEQNSFFKKINTIFIASSDNANKSTTVLKIINSQESVEGRVIDADTGDPLPGVNILVKGTTTGTSTDGDGNFQLTVDNLQATLVVTFIGYQRQEVALNGRSNVEVLLKSTAFGLDDIVVTATGEQRSREVGTSLSRITSDDILAASASNPQEVLDGRITGATILSNSGNPGTGGTIRLRGNNSISQNNDPIVYVDGIRISRGGTPTHQASRQAASPLNDINPNDILSIDVVKGAAATTLYGTEASGGVIRITTKQGTEGVTNWNLGVSTGFNNIGHFGPKKGNPTGLFVGRCRGDGLENYNGTKFQDSTCPDNDTWLQNGLTQRYDLSVSSGVKDFTYYISGAYENEQGIIQGAGGAEDLGFRGNFTFKPVEKVNIYFNSSFNHNNTDWLPSGNNGDAFLLNVTRATGGNFAGADGCDPGIICVGNGEILESNNVSTRQHFINSLAVSYQPLENFTNRVTVGYDYNTSESESTQFFGYKRTPLGQQDIRNWSKSVLSLEYLGTLDNTLSQRIGLGLSWGGQLFSDNAVTTRMFSEDFSGPQNPTLTSGARKDITQDSRIKVTTGGVFAQAVLSLDDQLFITGGVRVDGHSAFGENFGLQVYPKLSASYVISDFDFWPTNWWNSFLIRAAIGEAGQAPGAFDAVRTWSPIAGDDGQPGFTPNQLGNPDLGPERSIEFETGFTSTFFDGRITTDVTYYHQETVDALIPVPAIASEGFLSSQVRNVGTVTNSGVEVDLGLELVRSDNINWRINAGFSKDVSKAVDLGETTNIEVEFFSRTFIREGYPVPAIFGDKILNPDEIADPIYERDTYIGPSYPDKSLSLGTSVNVMKNITLDALGVFKFGGYMVNATAYQNGRQGVWPPCYEFQNADPNTLKAIDRAKCALNSSAVAPAYDHWIESTDFFKLRSLSVSYRLPNEWLVGGLEAATLKLTGRNLLTITNYSGTDPELSDNIGSLARRDYYVMPPYRTFLLSLNVRF